MSTRIFRVLAAAAASVLLAGGGVLAAGPAFAAPTDHRSSDRQGDDRRGDDRRDGDRRGDDRRDDDRRGDRQRQCSLGLGSWKLEYRPGRLVRVSSHGRVKWVRTPGHWVRVWHGGGRDCHR
ncbi:hypothetical protein ABZZ36_16500 [Actinacidiphila glaucinigra]|uniref:hypothetical protein n=1 Tax=Actinacidiphila glaucinigra TaxID=235986 RepID=UPI0033B273EE